MLEKNIGEVLISQEELQGKVKELGNEITKYYKAKDGELILICILKGSVVFLGDLMKEIKLPLKIDFMKISSYGEGMISSREVKIQQDLEESIYNKNILIIEDIIDTGLTLNKVLDLLKTREPASIKMCTLLNKPDRREAEVEIDFEGFKIPDKFVVGYGLDFAEKYRNLPYIGVIKENDNEWWIW